MSFAARDCDEETIVLLHFGGHVFEPLLSGALYWRAERTLMVADLHLEKLSYRRFRATRYRQNQRGMLITTGGNQR